VIDYVVRFLAGATHLSLLQRALTGSGAHPAAYAVDAGGSFPRKKQPERKPDHLHIFPVENEWR